MTIVGHTDFIFCICELSNHLLVSGSRDHSIKIWSLNKTNYKCEKTIIDAHTSTIYNIIEISNHRMTSCAYDKSIKIWKAISPFELITSLQGHNSSVVAILYLHKREELISISRDSVLRVWSMVTYQAVSIMNGISVCFSHSLCILDNKTISIGYNNIIEIIDINGLKVNKVFEIQNNEITNIYSLIAVNHNTIICGCNDGILYEYDFANNNVKKTKSIHTENIYDIIKINEKEYVSCGLDKTVCIWKKND